MRFHPLFAGLAAALAFTAIPALAADDEYGSKEEAQAMLERAVAALETDQDAALLMFTEGEGGFKDRDLYPYCGNETGVFTAHPSLVGADLRGLEDKTGEPFGAEIYEVAAEGEVAEVDYMWPRPGEEEPVEKVALVTKVGDQVCAVGYYVQ